MRLLSVIETLSRGGAEQALINNLVELQKTGVECSVATLFQGNALTGQLEELGIEVHFLNLSSKWRVFEGVYKLARLVSKNRYDIIHAHLFFSYFYTGLAGLFHPNIRTLTTFHNLGYNAFPDNTIKKKLKKKLGSLVATKLIDRKIAVSYAVKEHYIYHLGVKDIDILPNSFPLDSIRSLSNSSRNEALNRYVENSNHFRYYSITPGRLVHEKGHVFLIDALEILSKTKPNLFHFIVGAGPLETQIRQKIQEKNLQNVTLIPSAGQLELFALIKACDFVVVPSISEGFGMVVGEAMALEKPVIATEVGGIPDLVENEKEAILVPASDSRALADAMERLCLDKNLQSKLARNAAQKITLFDASQVAKKWVAYYQLMLKS